MLAPDRLGSRARLALGSGRTIEAPGGSQALVRSGVVNVELADRSTARVRRPTVVGPADRKQADLTREERSVLERMAESPELSALAQRSIGLLTRPPAHSD